MPPPAGRRSSAGGWRLAAASGRQRALALLHETHDTLCERRAAASLRRHDEIGL